MEPEVRHPIGSRRLITVLAAGWIRSDASDAVRLFDRFSSHRGGSSSGLGLGLWISRSLAEMHGGTLAGTSEGEGKGATFTLLMPAVPSTERQAAPAPHTARIANSCAKAP